MQQAVFLFCFTTLLWLLTGGASAFTSSQRNHHLDRDKKKLSTLHAINPPSSGSSWGSRSIPSKMARESAVNVEWEPMTELERRIEDGVNYKHYFRKHNPRRHHHHFNQEIRGAQDDDVPSKRGVFVGYRYTYAEYNRLKSAAEPEK